MAEKGVGRGLLKLIKSRQQSTGPGAQEPAQETAAAATAPPPPLSSTLAPVASTHTEPLTPSTPLTPGVGEPPLSGSLPRRVTNLISR